MFKCGHCGKDTKIGYSDDPNMALSHQWLIKCEDCYSETHPRCTQCSSFLMPQWDYCPKCGTKIKEE